MDLATCNRKKGGLKMGFCWICLYVTSSEKLKPTPKKDGINLKETVLFFWGISRCLQFSLSQPFESFDAENFHLGKPPSSEVINCRNVVKLMLPWHYRIDQRVNRPLKIFLHRPANEKTHEKVIVVGFKTSLDRWQLLWYCIWSKNCLATLATLNFKRPFFACQQSTTNAPWWFADWL